MELDLCASSKYIQILREEAGDGADNKELVTSAGAELRKSVVMVLQVGEQAVQALAAQDKLEKMEDWLNALAFLSSVRAKMITLTIVRSPSD